MGSIEEMVREISSTEVRSSEIGSFQGTSIEVRVTQVNPLQISSNQIASYLNSPKFSLPSSITLQQFLSSHNFNLQNTTVGTWTSFLQAQTPFNLNLSIQDLPIGRLAEAQITQFDSTGRPIALLNPNTILWDSLRRNCPVLPCHPG